MSNLRSKLTDMNAAGIGNQNLDGRDGGNNTRGPLDNFRPTGVVANGTPDAEGRELYGRFSKGARPMQKQRKM